MAKKATVNKSKTTSKEKGAGDPSPAPSPAPTTSSPAPEPTPEPVPEPLKADETLFVSFMNKELGKCDAYSASFSSTNKAIRLTVKGRRDGKDFVFRIDYDKSVLEKFPRSGNWIEFRQQVDNHIRNRLNAKRII